MLELRLSEGSLTLLQTVLESVNHLFVDAEFNFSSSGLDVQSLDSDDLAFVALHLKPNGFDHYQCDNTMSMGMKFNNMAKLLKCGRKDDIITLKADGIVACVMTQDKIDFEMNLKMKLIGHKQIWLPKLSQHLGSPEAENYESIVRMPSMEFAWICKALSSIGDTVVISVTNKQLKFSIKGKIGAADIVCTEKPTNSTIIRMNEPVSMTSFSLTYLNYFTEATVLSDTVTICLTSEFPVAVEYKIGEVGYIRFHLVPN